MKKQTSAKPVTAKANKSDSSAAKLKQTQRASKDNPNPAPNPQPQPYYFTIHGTVRNESGVSITGVTVRVYQKTLLLDTSLGGHPTDASGAYKITYPSATQTLNIIVRVFDRTGKTQLAESGILYRVPTDQTLDLVIPGGMHQGESLFLQQKNLLSKELGSFSLGTLAQEQITYLSQTTDLDEREITLLDAATRLAGAVNNPKLPNHPKIDSQVFYALFRAGLPTDLPSLLAQSPKLQRAALETALAQDLITLDSNKNVDQLMQDLVLAAVDITLKNPDGTDTTLSQILGRIKVNQAAFVKAYIEHQGAIEEFWTNLRANPTFKNQVDQLQLILQLDIVAQHHYPLVDELYGILSQPTPGSKPTLRDLAKYSYDRWTELVTDSPADVPGDSENQQKANYIKVIMRMLADVFPMAAIEGGLGRSSLPGRENHLTFITNNPGFDFRTNYIEDYLLKHPAALDGIRDPQYKDQLKAMQRVFRLTPYFEEMQALLADGIHSAQSVIHMGKKVFLNKYGGTLGNPRASQVYENAARISALALSLYGRFGSFNATDLHVLPKYTTPKNNTFQVAADTEISIPDWETLFGSLDMCACEECQSVYGPAAYLVDILHFLKDRRVIDQIAKDAHGNPQRDSNGNIIVTYKQVTSPEGKLQDMTVQDVLFERRPDLGEIDLNCENAFTPLPYVDLLNEVLENAVSPATASPAHDRQTTGTPQDLEANPQYQNSGAYDFLSQQVYPWGLPFDLWREEARIYLGHLGVQRADLMKTFQKFGDSSVPSDLEIACEYLGISTFERQIITGAELMPPQQPYAFWGYTSDHYPDTSTTAWIDDVSRVRTFLDRSSLSYDQLVELLKLKFINPLGSLVFNDPASCDTEILIIQNLSEQALDRIHRFVRLWRKLGWTMRELDKTFTALKPQDITDDFLQELAAIQQLHSRFNLPVTTVTSWYAPLDTASYLDTEVPSPRSQYKELFQNPAVIKLNSDDIDPFELTPDGTELKNSNGSLMDQSAHLAAALGVNMADLVLLINGNDLVPAVVTNDRLLKLENLSRLYRNIIFARSLSLTINDFLRIKAVTGIEPFVNSSAPVKPENVFDTTAFIEAVQKIQASKFTLDELDYLLRHQFSISKGIAPTEGAIALILEEIRNGLQKIITENKDADSINSKLESLINERISHALSLSSPITSKLLIKWVHAQSDPSLYCIADFHDPAFVNSNPNIKLTEALYPNQFKTYRRLHKIALFISKFKLTLEQLTWLFENLENVKQKRVTWVHDTDMEVRWLDLNELPLQALSNSTALFAAWERSLDLFTFTARYPLVIPVLTSLLNLPSGTNLDALLQQLSDATTWNLIDLQYLVGSEALGLNIPDDFKDEQTFTRFASAFAVIKQIGVNAEKMLPWIHGESTVETARNIKQTVKARYDDTQWTAIAKPLRDTLRNQQRAALVSYLIANPVLVTLADGSQKSAWEDSDGLYEYYLIDPEMDACMITSRIKQAIGSVQLFVQRCLMHLEDEVIVNAEVDGEWLNWKKWMKTYRVWEANRKIFLYPENWIEPELRDNKSPFFKDLENELMQNDVTQETAEAAFLNYLEKLESVAHLEICGFYHQVEQDGNGHIMIDILHVFGRTFNTPHVYYYRQQVNSSYWTPWERVDLDIEDDYLLPVIWNRRLYLFWPIFTEETESTSLTLPGSQGGKVEEPPRHWKIQLAWSEYKDYKWSPKKLLKEKIQMPLAPHHPQNEIVLGIDSNASRNLVISIQQVSYNPLNMVTGEIIVRNYDFQFDDCTGKSEVNEIPTNKSLIMLPGTHGEFMAFVENGGEHPLVLAKSNGATQDPNFDLTLAKTKTPGTFRVRMQQFQRFDENESLFFADNDHTYVVMPGVGEVRVKNWQEPAKVDLSLLTQIIDDYYTGLLTNQNFNLPVLASGDVLIGEPTIPMEMELQSFGVSNFSAATQNPGKLIIIPKYHFARKKQFVAYYHPYACLFIRELNRDGIDGLLQRPIQTQPENLSVPPSKFDFNTIYNPEPIVQQPYPIEDVDFTPFGSYELYNWELFFHIPLLIADRLSTNQRFEEAQRWYHYIFNLNDSSGTPMPQRYWQTKPFFETTAKDYQDQQIQEMLHNLALPDSPDPQIQKRKADLLKQVNNWRDHPFNPHLIARMRTSAYQKNVVMKYIDNLIAWGDQLFRKDTIESINEAAQLYILAAQILGRRPEIVKPRAIPQVETYNSLDQSYLGEFSDPLIAIENLLASPDQNSMISSSDPQQLKLLYFCVPQNDKLLNYWDIVADRLFKIRHCMNIEGVVRQLPLFEPPIDPGLLVRATASGVDFNSALSDSSAVMPFYRFNVMAQKASELCSDLKSLGGALLSALEKRDAESLSLLRSTQELQVLKSVKQIKEQQIEEAKQALSGLQNSREMTIIRHRYYSDLQNPAPLGLNMYETAHLFHLTANAVLQLLKSAGHDTSAMLHLAPDIKVGAPTTVGQQWGGSNLGDSSHEHSESLGSIIERLNTAASLSATVGSYQRRVDDWKFQERLASKETEQLDKQIIAAEIRLDIATKELNNHEMQIENAQAIDDFMHDKFTNQELYEWMVSQISSIYFQSYQLAYDVAKRAELAFRFELGLDDSSFIQFGYWDSLKKGLLAGERLYADIKRMEVAYLDQNKREYELTKHVSLVLLEPLALLKLKETGECFIDIPESLFDLDYPGHYMRRIKSASLTIPRVTGPYTNVNCTLTLVKNSIRKDPSVGSQYGRDPANDFRFTDKLGVVGSIATSSAQNDSGVFELNFRDERYLPFEGAGAIGQWRLELPLENNAFDFNTISDIVLHLKYTARDGGQELKDAAKGSLPTEGFRLFSLNHEYPTEWYGFLNPTSQGPADHIQKFNLSQDRFPFQTQNKNIKIDAIHIFALSKETSLPAFDIYLTTPGATPDESNDLINLTIDTTDTSFGRIPHKEKPCGSMAGVGEWTLKVKSSDFAAISGSLEDIVLVCKYSTN